PWIKHIHYKQSAFMSAGQTPSHIDETWQAILEYEAAVQPGGFYGERLPQGTHPPSHSRSTQDERNVVGVSAGLGRKVNWEGDSPKQIRQYTTSSKIPGEGGLPEDSLQSGAGMLRAWVERVNLFGLPPLATNSFILGDHNQFEALTEKGEAVQGRYG